jgi:hypothetical protein
MWMSLSGGSAARCACVFALAVASLSGCAAPPPVPAAPPPVARIEAPAPAAPPPVARIEAPAPAAPAPAVEAAAQTGLAEPAPAPAAVSSPASAEQPAGPSLGIDMEAPYKLGLLPAPRGQAEAAERDRWNRGGRGEPPAPPPPPLPSEAHPLPRIIVDIDKVKGPLHAREVERLARKQLWIHVFSCYRLGAYKAPGLRGKTTVRLTVSRAGKVTGARAISSTLPDADVVSCLAERTRSLSLPGARSGSTAVVTMQVFPGDDPVEPPPSALVAGEGELSREAITAAAAQAVPAWRSCYEAALANAPGLWGRLAIRFHVTGGGAVDEAFEVESRFPDDRMVRCVLRHARALAFPAPAGGGLRFIVPLRFSPDLHPL